MTFTDVEEKYTRCLGEGCRLGGRLVNNVDLDVLLSPEMEETEVQLSLLEDAQARRFQVALFHAVKEMEASLLGWKAPCGCWYLRLRV